MERLESVAEDTETAKRDVKRERASEGIAQRQGDKVEDNAGLEQGTSPSFPE